MDAARKRPEIASVNTTFLPAVPQLYIDVDRDRVLKQGVDLGEVYKTLQTFMGGYFVNYFNRFGRQWQVYVEAEGDYRTRVENLGLFYVRNKAGESIPMTSLTSTKSITGPEFTMRYNLYRCAQINGTAAPGLQFRPGHKSPGGCVRPNHALGNGLRLHWHVVSRAEGGAGRLAGGHIWPSPSFSSF